MARRTGVAVTLQPHCLGGGRVEISDGIHRFSLPQSNGPTTYCLAQLDDYRALTRDEFLGSPPLRLKVRARFSHGQRALQGTAGFGWWNAPFDADRAGEVAVSPRALWFFFASAPSNLAMGTGWSGRGLFAQALNMPTFPRWSMRVARSLLRLPLLEGLIQKGGRVASRAAELPLPDVDITEWHSYEIEWKGEDARFFVDGALCLQAEAPRGPLGLVIWIDNQWATLSGKSGLLTLPTDAQMMIDDLQLTTVDGTP